MTDRKDHAMYADDDDLDRILGLVLADPAIQAAADQLRASITQPVPGQDPVVSADRQRDVLRVIVHGALRRLAEELGVTLTPEILEYIAQHYERTHETPPDGPVT